MNDKIKQLENLLKRLEFVQNEINSVLIKQKQTIYKPNAIISKLEQK